MGIFIGACETVESGTQTFIKPLSENDQSCWSNTLEVFKPRLSIILSFLYLKMDYEDKYLLAIVNLYHASAVAL